MQKDILNCIIQNKMKKKIAVALWVDSMHVPAWVHEMLLHINAGGYASLQLVILNKSNHKKGGGSFAKLMRNFSYAAFILYRKFENRYAKVKPDAQQLKNVSDIIKSGAVIHVNPSQKNNHLFFTDNDIQQLRQQDIDVCIKIGNGILPDEALACSRYGFWRFDDGNDFIKRGIYSGVHEVINGEDVTVNALLMQLAGKDKPLVLYKSAGATANGIKKNINLVYRKSLSFIPRKLKQLHEEGGNDFMHGLQPYDGDLSKCFMPSNSVFIPYLVKYYSSKISSKLNKKKSFEQWVLMYHKDKGDRLCTDITQYKTITPPADRFWADPAVFSNGRPHDYIFIEEYLYKTKKAHISVIELDKDGQYAKPEIVLDKPYHLSYPFIFKEGDELYMIPESSANKTIELYRATAFPHKWEFVMNLMEGVHAVDATLHFYENKYWLFVNIKENAGASAWDELFIFYADDFRANQWKPHAANPVISDVRRARPAGRLYVQDGKLFRPSQDCSKTYGYATNLNEVLVLNENEYKEQTIKTIYPEWNDNVVATHTLSYQNGLAVLDAREKRKRN